VFAPGLGEINDIVDGFTQTIAEHGRKPADFWILPLHSSLPTSNQQRVFDAPPKGVTKIVVATNIAETSTSSTASRAASCDVWTRVSATPLRRLTSTRLHYCHWMCLLEWF
jgi:hypothetical protein